MKRIITLFALIFICVLNLKISYAQIPSYDLVVRNLELNSPTDNELTFDIYIRNTGNCSFAYAKGRYELCFNPLIANGGELSYDFVPGYSDLPPNMMPVNAYCNGGRLIMHYNNVTSSPSESIFFISNTFPGTRICRMKLATSAPVFSIDYLSLIWNNPGSGVIPVTRVFAYAIGFMMQVTSPRTHSIDSSGFNGGPLPVELSSFTSTVNNNIVTLNWSTVNELNNSGFDIERKSSNSDWSKIGFIIGNGTITNSANYIFSDKNLTSGKYNYRLKQIDFNGSYNYYELSSEINISAPGKFYLSQNYPNPFNPVTKVNFDIPFDSKVSLKLYDITGKEIKELINEFKPAGYYNVQINGEDISSGTYFYRLISDGNNQNFTDIKKMILIK